MAEWTEDDIATLKAAIASGVSEVTYAGPPARSVKYQSLPAMEAALARMERAVYGTATSSYRRVVFRSGFYGYRRCGSFRTNDDE